MKEMESKLATKEDIQLLHNVIKEQKKDNRRPGIEVFAGGGASCLFD